MSLGLESQYVPDRRGRAPGRPSAGSAPVPVPVGHLAAGLALLCFGFLGVLAFLSTGTS